MSLQWSHKEKKYLIEEKEDDLLPALMPPPVVKFELWQKKKYILEETFIRWYILLHACLYFFNKTWIAWHTSKSSIASNIPNKVEGISGGFQAHKTTTTKTQVEVASLWKHSC